MLHEFRADGITVHVVELLRHLRAGVHVEIIITALPEPANFAASPGKAKHQLTRAFSLSSAQGARNSLLETLDDLCGTGSVGLAQQQVHMLRHEDVANESKAIARSRLFERANGQIAGANGVQQGPALITAKGDEMEIAKSGDALQIFRHGGEEGPALSKT